jgi:hypothetical protein
MLGLDAVRLQRHLVDVAFGAVPGFSNLTNRQRWVELSGK